MMSHWQKKTLVLCVSAACAHFAVGTARADSAVGVNTTLGDALNPGNLKLVPQLDPEVLDAVPDERTPTGKLLGWPAMVPPTTKTAGGWQYKGELELGGMWSGGDTKSWWFNQYKDLPDSGVYLNNFYFQADNLEKGKGYFIEALGGGVGYRDQFEGVNFGRYNDWKVKLFYNETPHVFTTTYRSLWSGLGGSYLTLDGSGLVPGGNRTNVKAVFPVARPNAQQITTANNNAIGFINTASAAATAAQLEQTINSLGDTTLGIVRHTGGLGVEKWITNSWKFFGSYTNEHRTGSRPFGAVMGGGGGGGDVEIPESIDYDTQDIVAGLRFDDGVNNLNLQAQLSLFHNNNDTLTFENPVYTNTQAGITVSPNLGGLVVPGSVFQTGTFDLYPDNTYTNIRAEYARSMPQFYRSRLTATVSLSKFKQDDTLQPWTTNSMQGIVINGVDAYNKWNTPASLTKPSANAEIDTQLYDIGFVMKPTEKLDLNTKFRYYKTDNKTEFFACNAQTGQWGRLLNDGSGLGLVTPFIGGGINPVGTTIMGVNTTLLGYNGTGCNLGATQGLNLAPSVGNLPLRNIPFQYRKINFEFGGEYRIARGQSINAKYEYEQYHRDYRERDTTWESMVKLGYVNRAFQFGSLRLSGEYGERRGDSYNPDPYEEFYSASLGPVPLAVAGVAGAAAGTNFANWIHSPSTFRKYDLADRDRLALDLRLDLIALHDLDVGITGQYRDIKYPNSELGRTDHQSLGSATLDFNWQPSPRLGVTGWYTYQEGSLSQANVQSNGCVMGTNYIFYSDGFVANVATGAAPPTRVGATVVSSVMVTGNNWQTVCETPAPNSPLLPTSRMWWADTKDTNNAIGLGARYDLGFARMELDGTYIDGKTTTNYSYNAAALTAAGNDPRNVGTAAVPATRTTPALAANAATPAANAAANAALWRAAAGGMPDQDYNQQIINFNLVIPVSKRVAIRALYRYEQGAISDWHYSGVAGNPVPSFNTTTGGGTTIIGTPAPAVANVATPQAVYLDGGPQGYHTNTFGLLVQVNF